MSRAQIVYTKEYQNIMPFNKYLVKIVETCNKYARKNFFE